MGDELPKLSDALCLADLLEDAGLSTSAAAVLGFARRSYQEDADQARIIIAAAQHAVNRGEHQEAVALLTGVRGLSAAVNVSLASVALVLGDRVLAQDALAIASVSSGKPSPMVRAALAAVQAQLSVDSTSVKSAWEGALAAGRDVHESMKPRLIGIFASHEFSRFEAAAIGGERHTQRQALTVLETAAMLAASTLGATHPDAVRAQIAADLAGFEYASTVDHEQSVVDALERLRASAEGQLLSFGPLHPETIVTQISVAAAGFETARARRDVFAAREALVHLDHTRTEAVVVLGSRHTATIAAETNFATAQLELLYVQQSVARDADVVSRTADNLSALEQRADEVLGETHSMAVVLRRMTRVARAMADSGRSDSDYKGSVALRSRAMTVQAFGEPSPFGSGGYESVDRAAFRVSGEPLRHSLTSAYQTAKQVADAIAFYEQNVAHRKRVLGEEHPETLTSLHNLAYAYESAGRVTEAITLREFARRLDSDIERAASRNADQAYTTYLAYAYESAARAPEAITLYEQAVAAGRRRVLGNQHPKTLASRHGLAGAYESVGRVIEAITLYEQVVADRRRVLGEQHPDTLTTRHNLAVAYQSAGRVAQAMEVYEQVVTDRRRVLGNQDPETLVSRHNLAVA